MPEQRQGVRELQEALRSLEKRAKTAQRADGHPYSRREAAKQANAAPFHAGGLDARRVGEWLADNGRVPRDPDKVWALVQVWAKWSGDRSQQQTYWNALVEAAQPTSRRRLTLDDHVEAPNGEKVLSGSPWVSPPWMAPPSRSDLVERPELVEELLMALSGAKSADPMAVVAVCGAGGFGKTTLVKQVCQRPEIAEAFPGGLLWTELGQDRQGADLALLLNDLVEQLTRSRPSLSDPQQAGFRLGQVLETQPGPVPLIIDDVWREEQLQPFLMGGRSCQRLVTTRHRLGPLADPITVPVDQMPVGQATSLLTRGVDGIPAAAVDDLLKLTGRWPLLLDQTNRNIARRIGGDKNAADAAATVTARLRAAGPGSLDGTRLTDQQRRDQMVAASIAASTDLLTDVACQRYLELCVFAEDTDIPCAVLELLWGSTGGLDSFEVEQLCEELYDASLVSKFQYDPPAVRLHDVFRAHLRRLAGPDQIVQGNTHLVDAAAELLASTGDRDADQPRAWWTMPDQHSYLWEHLAEHLAEARRHELDSLLTDLRWAAARIRHSGPAGIEADLAHSLNPVAATLARAVRQNAHLLATIEPAHALDAILASRLDGIPVLQPLVDAYTAQLENPRLANRWPLPDQSHPAHIRTLAGHRDPVLAVAIAPDGSWLATSGYDATVRIWAPATGTCRHILSGHTGPVKAVAIAPDGSWLATSGYDVTVRIWDSATGACRRTLTSPSDRVVAVLVAPNGSWLATGMAGQDGIAQVWDPATGSCLHTLTAHGGSVAALAIGRDSSWLATGGWDNTVRIWDPATGDCRHSLTGHTGPVKAAAVAADGSWLATAGGDTVRIWDPATGVCRHTLTGHTHSVDSIAVAPDWLAAGCNDGTVRIWDTTVGMCLQTLTGHVGPVLATAAAPDGMWLATASGDGTVRLWDPVPDRGRDPSVAHPASLKTEGADYAVIAPDGSWLATSGHDHTVRVWDPATGDCRHTLTGHTLSVGAVAVAPDGTWLATASSDGTARVWDAATGVCRHTLSVQTRYNGSLLAVATSPDGTWLATAGDDANVRIWNPATGKRRRTLTGHTEAVWAVTVAPDGTWLATGSDDATARIWNPATGDCRHTLTGHTRRVGAIAVAPDGTWLATCSDDATVRVWDSTTSACRHILVGHDRGVVAATIAPDGTWLATTDYEHTVRIWDPATGKCRYSLTGHTDLVPAVAVAPDGIWLATAGWDGTVRVWDPASGTPYTIMRVNTELNTCVWLEDGPGICTGGRGGVYVFDLVT